MSDEVKVDGVETPVEAAPEKLYFGIKPVKEWGEGKGQVQITDNLSKEFDTGLIWVVYDDGTREVMHKDEWSGGKSTAPRQEDFSFDRDRLQSAATEVLKVLKGRNVRLEDIRGVITLMIDSLQLATDQAKELAMGVPAWSVRIDDIQKVLDDAQGRGEKPPVTQVIRKVQGGLIDY